MNAQLVSELVEGQNLFDSRGYSIVRVTKNGEPRELKLPIKSTGVSEFQEMLSGEAPRPPVRHELIKMNSPEGKALGLKHDAIRTVFDGTDETYVDALDKHNREFTWKVVIFALDLAWKRKDGTVAETYEERRKILASNGISIEQATQVFKDVQALTTLRGSQEDFLPGN